jgi:uncharacterized integral membrane protein
MTTVAKAKLAGAIVIVALIIIVFLQNGEPVRFKFLFFDAIEIAKTLLILGSMLVGVVGTLVVQLFWRQRKRLRAAAHSELGTQNP